MTYARQQLLKILSRPIFPHECADPTEVVADYLLDNDVVPVVRCKNCRHYKAPDEGDFLGLCTSGIVAVSNNGAIYPGPGFYCLYGERRTL